uniref:NR LBD domain-containing protein n=1 Tax=Angiostrongylus cantonensis TaxID=6313 RepID=A0A0K0DAE5_ANGCA
MTSSVTKAKKGYKPVWSTLEVAYDFYSQSRSTCSNQSARTQSTFPQTRNIKQNDAPLRCTCPHPPGNRATVQSAQAIPHPSFLSHSFTGHHTACHHPNPPKLARTSAIFTPSQTSASCPSDYCNPQFARAQMIHSDQNDKNIDGRIRRICNVLLALNNYLRAHLKHSGELFVVFPIVFVHDAQLQVAKELNIYIQNSTVVKEDQ